MIEQIIAVPSAPLIPTALSLRKICFNPHFYRFYEQGFNPDVRCIRHTLDPVVPFAHRPLTIYAILGAGRAAIRVFLNLCGFRRGLASCGTFSYWHREACVAPGIGDGNAVGGPVVFFHGVGSGLPWYILAIWQVCRRRVSL